MKTTYDADAMYIYLQGKPEEKVDCTEEFGGASPWITAQEQLCSGSRFWTPVNSSGSPGGAQRFLSNKWSSRDNLRGDPTTAQMD